MISSSFSLSLPLNALFCFPFPLLAHLLRFFSLLPSYPERFILLCSTGGGILRRRRRVLSLSLADIHAIYPGPVPNTQVFVLQTSARILLFRAPTDSIMLDWVAEIKAALAWENANGSLWQLILARLIVC